MAKEFPESDKLHLFLLSSGTPINDNAYLQSLGTDTKLNFYGEEHTWKGQKVIKVLDLMEKEYNILTISLITRRRSNGSRHIIVKVGSNMMTIFCL